MTITTDGQLADWTASDRLERPTTTVANYEVYGRFENDTFHVALHTSEPGVAIGTGTTLWLNTDDDTATGYQIFGFAGGVEFRLEVIDVDFR